MKRKALFYSIAVLLFTVVFIGKTSAVVCEITKENGGGFTTTIESVTDNCDNTFTIVLRVEHDGCGGPSCKELSHYSVEADPGTYSDISVDVREGGMEYGFIDYGPNLGSDPFDGFKLDETSGIGGGMAGVFAITYTLSGGLQDQQASAKAGSNGQIVGFTTEDFEYVMGCAGTNCGGGGDPDTDGDGCPDSTDEYPLDPDRCYSWTTDYGTLAYEDLWPATGDYDFNDAIVVYQVKFVANADNEVVDLETSWIVTAVGASYKNGFAIQFDNLVPEDVLSVTGSVYTESYISLNANGTEANQEKAVVIIFDNNDAVINRVGGSFFNTLENGFIGTSDTTEVTITFDPPLDPVLIGDAPFNPFLIKNGNRDIEIHLADYVPTSLADPSYFGNSQDDSNPATGRYYRTDSNLPWAIHIPVVLDHMIEYIEIPQGYLHFSEWAESDGTQYQNWYEDLPGYRDNSKIWYAD